MADIWNRQSSQFGGAISADACQLTFTGGHAGLLVQNMGINYAQQIRRIWEIGSRKTYFIAGRPAGNLTIARIVGPVPLSSAFLSRFGDVCNAADNVIKISGASGCSTKDGYSGQYDLTMTSVVLDAVAYGITMADMVLNQTLRGSFSSLKASEQAG